MKLVNSFWGIVRAFSLLNFLVVFCSTSNALGQNGVTLEFDVIPAKCSGDGGISARVVGDDNLEDLNFRLYRQANPNTVFQENQEGEFTGLREERYRLIASFVANGDSIELTENIQVTSDFTALRFSLQAQNECEDSDGSIEAIVSGGSPQSYELGGPVNKPPQASPLFEELPAGRYTVWVTDSCENRLSQEIEILRTSIEFQPTNREFKAELPECGSITVGHRVRNLGAPLSFPLQANFSITFPDGTQSDVEEIVEEEDMEDGYFYADIPFFHGQAYVYDLSLTDACGNTDSHENLTIDRSLTISDDFNWGAGFCGNRRIAIQVRNFHSSFTVNFTEHPDDFDPESEQANYPGPFDDELLLFGSVENPIPEGTYRIEVEDACGNTDNFSFNHSISITDPYFNELKSCTEGLSTLEMMNWDYQLLEVELLEAPPEYTTDLPQDLTGFVNQNDLRRMFLTDLPAGEYRFRVLTNCGEERFGEYTVEGTEIAKSVVEVEQNCGTFNIFLDHEDNFEDNQNVRFGLQKLDLESGQWVHPATEAVYEEGQEITANNSLLLNNMATNYNISHTGKFRVVKSARVWKSGDTIQQGQNSSTHCIQTLKTFDFQGRTILRSANFYQCDEDNFELSLSADGYDPLNFQIRQINGEEVLIDNGDNPLFSNLSLGRYKFRIEDRCGNIQNAHILIGGENLPKITPENLCPGEAGRLFIPFKDFLSVEWYREGDPANILSDSTSLWFDSFDPTIHNGTYIARLSHTNEENCLDAEVTFTISEELIDPNPGTGQTATVCEGEIVDLFDYLDGEYSDFGIWEEITESDRLIGNFWAGVDLTSGTYRFRYSVNGMCSGDQSTIVTLQLNSIPPAPEGPENQEFCESNQPTLEEIEIEGESVEWFESLESEEPLPYDTPLEDERRYFATQTIDGCTSEDRLEVKVKVFPEITENNIEGEQQVYQMETPDKIVGLEPLGGEGLLSISWEYSEDGQNWVSIEDAVEVEYQPEPLMESTYFRRVVTDEKCEEEISNEVLIEVIIAPILAEGDEYGPLKGYETNLLPILENDTFKGSAIDFTSGEISGSILEIADEDGEMVNLDWQITDEGNLVVPEGSLPGRYVVSYQICQANIPENCSEASVEVWVGILDLDIEKLVDRTQAVEGEIITYTIEITNTSDFDLEAIQIEDLLPENVMVLQAMPAFTQNNSWESGILPIGETLHFEIDALTLAEGNIMNQVRVRIGDFDQTVDSPVTQVRAKSVDLVIDKSTNAQEIVDGDEFVYTLTLTNRGLDEATGVTIVDELPTEVDHVESTVSNNPDALVINFTQNENRLIWEVEEFPVGSELTITITVVAMEVGPAINRANVGSEETDVDESNNSDSVTVDIAPLFIPNVFKPDNDGKNETFIIRASHKFSKISLLIFNRWGDPVFESEDYQNDWNAEGVNGGTYYYLIKGVDARNQERRYKGWVQVLK
ncbi:T9SS type B sorting domain-containing protein [Pleomorphovibrio marinus]|uniref:T9SS type B sorting domain-containing protein n=1 Tax=Pleomorphovibrio marinus TaxID=2164132 RepID=UPI000E09EDF7|nr:gliding motility-associated C-terminal domain-containing protein [Pleomorphovibrio marinus]